MDSINTFDLDGFSMMGEDERIVVLRLRGGANRGKNKVSSERDVADCMIVSTTKSFELWLW